jgi:transposase-like protein
MRISQAVKDQIILLYNQNNSINSIHKITRVSNITISKILKAAGCDIKSGNYMAVPIDDEYVNDLYNKGMSTYDIALLIGCSDETIRKKIKKIRSLSDRNKRNKESKDKIRQASLNNWQQSEYISKMKLIVSSAEYKSKMKEVGIRNYDCSLGKWIKSIESKAIISSKLKQLWSTNDYRNKQKIWFGIRSNRLSEGFQKMLSDPIKRSNWIEKVRLNSINNRSKNGWISTSQKQLYYILSDSEITFHEEGDKTKVGPFYVVDCVIPQQQNMLKPLIIEVQGEYWHSLPHVIVKDAQKSPYVRKHTNYDLLYIDELHLASYEVIRSKLATYGLSLRDIKCKPKDLTIRQINESEAQLFYSIFHYTGSVRKGATVYGAFLEDDLVACISYCYPLRIQTVTKLGYKLRDVLEISRMARKTNLVCPNLFSFFINKTIKLLSSDIKCIVSFSDTLYGHTGGVYKASGFKLDGLTSADYYYASMSGKYHKKTIWDRAKRMKMSEADYALKHGLHKIQGKPKARWVYRL